MQIYFMEWSLCSPGGVCTSYERRWYTSSFGETINCTRNGSFYDCGFARLAQSYPILNLYIDGVGSPKGTWTLKLRALNFKGTFGIQNYSIVLN